MSFKIGQLNSDKINPQSAIEDMTFTIQSLKKTSEFAQNTKFFDRTLRLSTGLFKSDSYYYIQLAICKFGLSQQDLTFQLSNGQESSTSSVQFLNNMTNYPSNTGGIGYMAGDMSRDFAIVEMIVSPNDNYSNFDIILTRNIYDYVQVQNDDPLAVNDSTISGVTDDTVQQNDSTDISQKVYQGRVITLDKDHCRVCQINNLIPDGKSPFNKIGIQGPSGMLFCINGEGIRIGPSGIYEIRNSNYKIHFLGAIPQISIDSTGKKGYDSFIIDYQYDQKDKITTDSINQQSENQSEGGDT